MSDTPRMDATLGKGTDWIFAEGCKLERDRARLIEALAEFLEPEHLRTYEQFKACLDRARALLKELQ